MKIIIFFPIYLASLLWLAKDIMWNLFNIIYEYELPLWLLLMPLLPLSFLLLQLLPRTQLLLLGAKATRESGYWFFNSTWSFLQEQLCWSKGGVFDDGLEDHFLVSSLPLTPLGTLEKAPHSSLYEMRGMLLTSSFQAVFFQDLGICFHPIIISLLYDFI